MSVHVLISSIECIPEARVLQMESLYNQYYTGGVSSAFRRDLFEKNWVIQLFSEQRLIGFSTQKFIQTGDQKYVLFSGDTVVDAAARNQYGLAGGFGHLIRFLEQRHQHDKMYWFLISKGARTYRFLPTFFKKYVPSLQEEPELRAILNSIAASWYPREFNSERGILHFTGHKDRLIADEIRNDPASVFFREKNPLWAQGDELCCLAPLSTLNLNRRGLRVISAVTPEWEF